MRLLILSTRFDITSEETAGPTPPSLSVYIHSKIQCIRDQVKKRLGEGKENNKKNVCQVRLVRPQFFFCSALVAETDCSHQYYNSLTGRTTG